MSDLKLNRDISLDFCTPLALRLIWCKTFISIGLLVPHYSGPDGSAAQPALLKIVLHHVWFFTYSNILDTCSLLYQHIFLKCMKSHLFFTILEKQLIDMSQEAHLRTYEVGCFLVKYFFKQNKS